MFRIYLYNTLLVLVKLRYVIFRYYFFTSLICIIDIKNILFTLIIYIIDEKIITIYVCDKNDTF